jgi:hypothetical protein
MRIKASPKMAKLRDPIKTLEDFESEDTDFALNPEEELPRNLHEAMEQETCVSCLETIDPDETDRLIVPNKIELMNYYFQRHAPMKTVMIRPLIFISPMKTKNYI